MKNNIYRLVFALMFTIIIITSSHEQTNKTDTTSTTFPGKEWSQMNHPEQSGWDTSKLDSLKKYLIDSTSLTGFMIIQQGKIVFDYGDIQELSYIASCRKSVLSMLYGEHIKSGEINLHTTLKELSIDDVGGLLPLEKEATIEDIISARSGVFHPASYPGSYLDVAPKRGTVKHGTYWLYSNWDFDLAGYIFEKETHRDNYDEVERMLAVPLQMQDWDRSLQHKEGDSTLSIYPAYPMYFSTRDMARIGLVMLNNGRWNDKQVIDSAWVKEMITPRTNYKEVNRNIPPFRGTNYFFGYGYLWWIWQNITDERFRGGYSAMGKMEQSITVFPAAGVVIAYKTKDVYERSNSHVAMYKILTIALQAYK